MELTRPYVAAFSSRFLLLLQYRAAAVAGFMTQCWWGAIKVMIYAAFYHASPAAASAPITLAQTITYTWLAQGFLALTPWGADPDVGLAVRTGAVGYDRLRPVDTYFLWYARAAGWMTARALPRAALMFALAGVVLPLLGLDEWALSTPPNITQALMFGLSLSLAITLSCAVVMLLNVAVTAALNDRWVNSVLSPFTIVLTGQLIPLSLYPDWMHRALFVQPFAGLVDIPFRVYSGNLSGASAWFGIVLQAFWTIALVLIGRVALERVMQRVEMQGS